MVAFNFQARFAPLVEQGIKAQTIRRERKNGRPPCKPGDQLQLYTGMRTRSCRKLTEAACTRVDRFKMHRNAVYVDEHGCDSELVRYGSQHALRCFARDDGFSNWPEMRDWFDKTHGLPFIGWLITWEAPQAMEDADG